MSDDVIIDNVFTGPNTHADIGNSTSYIMDDMISQARRNIWIVCYWFDYNSKFFIKNLSKRASNIEINFIFDDTEPNNLEKKLTILKGYWAEGAKKPNIYRYQGIDLI